MWLYAEVRPNLGWNNGLTVGFPPLKNGAGSKMTKRITKAFPGLNARIAGQTATPFLASGETNMSVAV
jgi:hypothetical protein